MGTSRFRLVVLVSGTALVACGAMVACGSDDPSTASPGDGGTTGPAADSGSSGRDAGDAGDATTNGGSDAQTPLDAGAHADADADAAASVDAAPPPLPGRDGNLLFQQQHLAFYLPRVRASFVQAGTYDDAGSAGIPECPSQPINAACVFTSCVGSTPDAGTPPTYSQAGVITVTGGSAFPSGGVVLTPNTLGGYQVTSPAMFAETTPTVTAGDTLTFIAAGDAGGVGEFRVPVVMPPDVSVTAPVITDIMAGGTTSFPRSQDLIVRWTPTPQGALFFVSVMVTVSDPDVPQKVVSCTFDGSSGSGTVPSANGLAKLGFADSDGGYGELGFFTENVATTTAGQTGGSAGARDAWLITATAQGTIFNSTFTTTD